MLRIKKKNYEMKVVCPWDPAIDVKKSDVEEYLTTLDLKHLNFKSGTDPVIVHLNPSPQWIVTRLMKTDPGNAQGAVVSCFCHSVSKIENLAQHVLTDDVELEGGSGVWHPSDKTEGPDGESVPCIDEKFAISAFNLHFMTYVSSIMQKRAFLRPGISKPYAQLPSFFLPTTEKKASS